LVNRLAAVFGALFTVAWLYAAVEQARAGDAPRPDAAAPRAPVVIPEPKQAGGEAESIVRVGNLIYAGTKTSKCFSEHFLAQAERESTISTSRRLHPVKLGDAELFEFPLVIMTGEGGFELLDSERQNLRKFVENGGLLLASAGCSSPEWDRSFRAEMARVFPDHPLTPIGMDHPVFHTVYDIQKITLTHAGQPRPIEGVSLNNRLGVLYSQDGLNDTAHSQGCCCCGGNEIGNCIQVNVNILAYSLLY
jgi:hypothetical protein